MSIEEKASVITEMKTTFSSGDSLILTYHNVKFYGYKEGYLYEVKYLERQEGKYGEDLPTPGEHHFMVSNTEYYPALFQDEAIKAFLERSTGLIETRTTKSHHLDDCLEKEGEFKFGFNSTKTSENLVQAIPISEEVLTKRESSAKLGDFLRIKLIEQKAVREAGKKHLDDKLNEYSGFKHNWGGEDEKPPTENCVLLAKTFLTKYPDVLPLPLVAIGASGSIMFYDDYYYGYWEVVFTPETNISFFSRKRTGRELFKENILLEEITPEWFSKNIDPLK